MVELNKKRKGLIKAKILKLLKPSKNRIEPKCDHFEMCGGCSWQNLNYSEQLKQKEKLVIDAFKTFFEKGNDFNFYSISPSEDIFEYRNKMEFSFSENRKKTPFLGLMIKGARRFVFNVERCHLASFWFSKVLVNIRAWVEKHNLSSYNIKTLEGFLRTLTIKETKNTNEKLLMLSTSHEISLTKEQKEDFINCVLEGIDDKKISIFLNTMRAIKGQRTTFELEKIYGNNEITEDLFIDVKNKRIKLSFKIGPFSFFQPNPIQAQKLYSIAINYSDLDALKDQTVFDLYSGTGTLGMILSLVSKKVIGIELNEDAYQKAQENIKLNNIKNFEMVNGDVSKVLDNYLDNKPSLIVVDPPRAGLDSKAIENILKMQPDQILYISCNPKTQAEDVKVLIENGYKLEILHPIDQFPHTYHIENIAYLKRA